MSEKPQSVKPTRKVTATAIAGAVTTLIISLITRRFGIELSIEESNAILLIVSFWAGYLTPNP